MNFSFGFWLGGAMVYALSYAAIQNHRIKGGYDNPRGSALWSIWVVEALYGAGSREDWRIGDAVSYIVIGFAWWCFLHYRAKRVGKSA